MASLSHHLIPSLIFIFTATINGGIFAQPPTNICPSLDCGNNDGVVIAYPFWHQTPQTHQHYCGYQSFNVLSCINDAHNNNPVLLNLSNHLFHVKTINYSENSLTILYPDHQITTQAPPDHNCPKIHNFTLTNIFSSRLFNFTIYNNNKTLRFFYNCSLYPPSLPDIACLRFGSKRSYVFMGGKIPEFDWDGYCETFASLPVNENVDGDSDREVLVRRALSEGFKLTWQTPIGACRTCEASYGFCGYNRNGTDESFFCICPDGRHSFHCGDKGSVTVTFIPNYFHIGELIFGGLLVIAAVFYFIRKKERFALYKPVSPK
ncbi:hypothetical protein ACOSQ3_007362 [Xanthoceras sorbifolium]